MAKHQIYPEIKIDRIKKPSRVYAIPFFGFFLKILMIIPVAIELFFLNIVRFIFSILNSFSIFFSGKYWKVAYSLNLGVMKLETNVAYFLWGLTDVYPGFALETTKYDLFLPVNKAPNKLLATPLLGMLFRFIVMIPYMIYRSIVSNASMFGVWVSWIPVLFKGYYPETTYEIVRDSVRVDQAATAYFLGMSDSYPSFWISMHHETLKLILLVIAALITLMSFGGGNWGTRPRKQMQQNFRSSNSVQNSTRSVTY